MTNNTTPKAKSIKVKYPYKKPKVKKYFEIRKIITDTAYTVKINLGNEFFNSIEV